MGLNMLQEVANELKRARKLYPDHPTLEHSAFVLLEEVNELFVELYKKPSERDMTFIRDEAIQVSAMAIRLVEDNIDG